MLRWLLGCIGAAGTCFTLAALLFLALANPASPWNSLVLNSMQTIGWQTDTQSIAFYMISLIGIGGLFLVPIVLWIVLMIIHLLGSIPPLTVIGLFLISILIVIAVVLYNDPLGQPDPTVQQAQPMATPTTVPTQAIQSSAPNAAPTSEPSMSDPTAAPAPVQQAHPSDDGWDDEIPSHCTVETIFVKDLEADQWTVYIYFQETTNPPLDVTRSASDPTPFEIPGCGWGRVVPSDNPTVPARVQFQSFNR